jgi:hypothetical protein
MRRRLDQWASCAGDFAGCASGLGFLRKRAQNPQECDIGAQRALVRAPASMFRSSLCRMRLLVRCLLPLVLAACAYDWSVGSQGASSSGGGSGDSCWMLYQEVQMRRSEISMCTSTCNEPIADECGCTVYVESSQSQASMVFAGDVQSFRDTGCAPRYCDQCPPPQANPTCNGGYCS